VIAYRFVSTSQAELETLIRGTVDVMTREDLLRKLEKSRSQRIPLKIKLGVDPSTADLHLGHVVVLKKLKAFQDLGHQVMFIIGDATGRVGDPSGRSATRNLLTEEVVVANAKTYQEQVFKILDRQKTQVVFNSSWFSSLRFDEVITLTSRYTVARMLERDDFSKRMKEGNPVSIVEFLYPLMQGYDSVMLKSDVELGGTDQTFNLLVGRTLQKDYGQESQVVMTMPLLIGTDGVKKMSKSFGNAISIVGAPSDMYGLVMSIPDQLMPSYYEWLTDIPLTLTHPREAKMRLARELVTMFHGEKEAGTAEAHFEKVFSRREAPDQVPVKSLEASEVKDGTIPFFKLMVLGGLASSHAEARRLITQGAVEVNDQRVTDPGALWDVRVVKEVRLKVGKRRFMTFTI